MSPGASIHSKAKMTLLAQHGPYHVILLQLAPRDLVTQIDFGAFDTDFIQRMDEVMAQTTNHEEDFRRFIKEVDFFCLTHTEVESEACQIIVDSYLCPWLEHVTDGHARKLTWWDANGGFWAGWHP